MPSSGSQEVALIVARQRFEEAVYDALDAGLDEDDLDNAVDAALADYDADDWLPAPPPNPAPETPRLAGKT